MRNWNISLLWNRGFLVSVTLSEDHKAAEGLGKWRYWEPPRIVASAVLSNATFQALQLSEGPLLVLQLLEKPPRPPFHKETIIRRWPFFNIFTGNVIFCKKHGFLILQWIFTILKLFIHKCLTVVHFITGQQLLKGNWLQTNRAQYNLKSSIAGYRLSLCKHRASLPTFDHAAT